MKKKQQLFFGLTIALIALYYTLRNVSFVEVASSFQKIDYFYIFPAVLIIMSGYVFRAYRWQALLESSLHVKVSGLFSPMMIGFMGNFLPARAAEVLRPYLLSKKYNISFSAAFASIVMERLCDLIVLLMVFIWVFWFEADVLSSEIQFSGFSIQEMAVKFGQVCLLAISVLVIFIYLLLSHKPKLMELVYWFLSFLPRLWGDKIIYLVEEFAVGCKVVKNFRTLIKISIHSFLIWAGNIFYFYPLYVAYDLQNQTISSLLILAVIVSILITIVPTPGFLGSFNAGVFIALHEIMGEPEIKAVSMGMVGWALFSGVVLLSGLYFILHDQISIKTLLDTEKKE